MASEGLLSPVGAPGGLLGLDDPEGQQAAIQSALATLIHGAGIVHQMVPPMGPSPSALPPIGKPAIVTRSNPTAADIQAIRARAAEHPKSPWPTAQNPIFDTSIPAYQSTDFMVPQVSVRDQLPPLLPGDQMPLGDRFGMLRENAAAVGDRMAEKLYPMVQRQDPMLYFYGTGPVHHGLQEYAGHTPAESVAFMRDWAGQGAATSPQTTTPPNLRNASFLLHNWAQGTPLTPDNWTPAQNIPGYGMMGMHVSLADQFRNGTIDPWNNPKPFTFQNGWSGNTADVVADMHVGRQNMIELDNLFPGQLPPSMFRNNEVYQKYKEGGGLGVFKDLSSVFSDKSSPLKMINGRGARVEYPIWQLPLYHAAEKLGIQPGQAQSGAWFAYGPQTGLSSPPKTIPQLLNDQLEDTARTLGVPTEKALEWWGRGKIPLSSNAPGDVPYA